MGKPPAHPTPKGQDKCPFFIFFVSFVIPFALEGSYQLTILSITALLNCFKSDLKLDFRPVVSKLAAHRNHLGSLKKKNHDV